MKRRITRPRTKRRVYRRRTYKRKATIPRKIIGIPLKQYAKLPYSGVTAFNVTASTLATQIFQLNGLYDPDFSGIGVQPNYFDQLMAMYTNYRVYGCKVTYRISAGTSTANCFHMTAALIPANTVSLYANMSSVINSRKAIFKIVTPTANGVTLSRYYSMSRDFGFTKADIATESRFEGTASSNPSQGLYAVLYIKNNDGTITIPVTWEYRLVYYAKFYNPVQIAPS